MYSIATWSYTWPTIGWKHVRAWTRTFGHGLWYVVHQFACILDTYKSWGWILLVFSMILCFAVIKLRYPFWNSQPVFHTYDWWRYGYRGVAFPIQRHGPTKNKYHCPDQIRTWSYADLPTDPGPSPIIDPSAVSLCDEWVHFIQAKGKGQGDTDSFSTVTADILHSLLSGGSTIAPKGGNCSTIPTYVSMYQAQTLAIDKDHGTVKATRGPIEACMVSRPYSMRTPYIDLRSVYVLEYICATTVERYRQILQTHVFQQRTREPSMDLSILRVQGAPCVGIVPWLQYTSWTVDLRTLPKEGISKQGGRGTPKRSPLPAHYHCNRIQTPTDVSHILDFMGNAPVFDVVVMPNKASILASTGSKSKVNTSTSACSYYVFALKHRKIDVAYYLFKDAHVHHDDMDSATLVCIGSVSLLDPAVETSAALFRQGWMCALQEIRSLFPEYQCLVIEGTSHNVGIVGHLQDTYTDTMVSQQPQYVYLHNYVHPPMSSTDAYRWLFLS